MTKNTKHSTSIHSRNQGNSIRRSHTGHADDASTGRAGLFALNALTGPLLLALGASSLLLSQTALAADGGDAPASYGVALHEILPEPPRLGVTAPDDDPTNLASDDNTGIDDEDGVFAFPTLVQNTKAYTTNVFVTNPTAQVANLVGWVDFNGDGVFAPEEASVAAVPPGADNEKIKLIWPDLSDVSSDFVGDTYARFRVSTDLITPFDSTGTLPDGEVEDYQLMIQPDADGDEIPDAEDPDDDNDLIPDSVEGLAIDSDGDGLVDGLDTDSDNDLVPDFFEAGADPSNPQDTDNDGIPDYLDLDSDGDGDPDSLLITSDLDGDGIVGEVEGIGDADADGIINSFDIDSDNDGITDIIETANDSDGDGVPNYIDLDSDNDGVSDLIEASHGVIDVAALDTDGNGRIDPTNIHGENGLVDSLESFPDSGVTQFILANSDADGAPDFLDLDSDGDGSADLVEIAGSDADGNSQVDALIDSDGDGIIDSVDISSNSSGFDSDRDGIIDSADIDSVDDEDTDLDGIADASDPDVDGNGFIDQPVNFNSTGGLIPDADGDGIPDSQDSITGVNDDDTNGNGMNLNDDVAGIGQSITLNASTGGSSSSSGGNGPVVETGLRGNGGGCSVASPRSGTAGGFDPLLGLTALLSMLFLVFRKPATLCRKLAVTENKSHKD